jgi:corrinoid protein of di/trimethylamine methyltransferase
MADDLLQRLRKAVLAYDAKAAAEWAERALGEGVDPVVALDVLSDTIREVGDGFGRGELWLPELVGAADAMQAALPILEEEIYRTGSNREALGTVVIGTVFGDIHTIGKSMVSTLLVAEGFRVVDLGVDVTAEVFAASVEESRPDVLAMSALMTMTAHEQMEVIQILKERGLRDQVKVMVGGGAITQGFADGIGADGYDPTAPGAVRLARRLIGVD